MWVFFQYSPMAGDVLDVKRTNENFLAVSQLFSGGLGEHSWAEACIDAVTETEESIAIRHIARAYEACPWTAPTSTGFFPVEQTTDWQPVHDVYYSREFITRGGEVEAIASFNTAVVLLVGAVSPGISFALMVDGEVMAETIVGSGDASSDEIRYAPAFKLTGAAAVVPETGGYGPGIRGYRQGVEISWRGRLPPGKHKIELAYRNISGSDNGASPQGIGQGELNIWEYWS